MKNYVKAFCQRGLMFMAGGPIIMAIIYWVLKCNGVVEYLHVDGVVKGILSSSLMGFIAAGISVVYSIERLPMLSAILIHGGVLYLDYILVYLLNGWLKQQLLAIAIFTSVFIVGYAIIWLAIWLGIRRQTADLNDNMKKRSA